MPIFAVLNQGYELFIKWAIYKEDKVRRLPSENRNREHQGIVWGLQNNYLIENLVQVPTAHGVTCDLIFSQDCIMCEVLHCLFNVPLAYILQLKNSCGFSKRICLPQVILNNVVQYVVRRFFILAWAVQKYNCPHFFVSLSLSLSPSPPLSQGNKNTDVPLILKMQWIIFLSGAKHITGISWDFSKCPIICFAHENKNNLLYFQNQRHQKL